MFAILRSVPHTTQHVTRCAHA